MISIMFISAVSIEPLKLNDSREAESTSNFGAEWNKLKSNTMMMDVITVVKTQNQIGLVIVQLHSLSPVLLPGTMPRKNKIKDTRHVRGNK